MNLKLNRCERFYWTVLFCLVRESPSSVKLSVCIFVGALDIKQEPLEDFGKAITSLILSEPVQEHDQPFYPPGNSSMWGSAITKGFQKRNQTARLFVYRLSLKWKKTFFCSSGSKIRRLPPAQFMPIAYQIVSSGFYV